MWPLPDIFFSSKLTLFCFRRSEPPEARIPQTKWRLYIFKKGELLEKPLHLHRQSAYLFGRDETIADVLLEHPSCSKQHAVLQFRLVEVPPRPDKPLETR